jgi:hypothetical protein
MAISTSCEGRPSFFAFFQNSSIREAAVAHDASGFEEGRLGVEPHEEAASHAGRMARKGEEGKGAIQRMDRKELWGIARGDNARFSNIDANPGRI